MQDEATFGSTQHEPMEGSATACDDIFEPMIRNPPSEIGTNVHFHL